MLEESLQLRQWWQFASVCQFLHMYIACFGLDSIDSTDLENHLINASDFICTIQVKILRKFVKNRMAYLDEIWLQVCAKEFAKRLEPADWPFEYFDGIKYSNLTLYQRVLLLYFICEIQFDSPEFKAKAESLSLDPTQWRVSPVGYDSLGYAYWLFDGIGVLLTTDSRLYREAPWLRENATKVDKYGKLLSSRDENESSVTIVAKQHSPVSINSDKVKDNNESTKVQSLKIKFKAMGTNYWKLVCASSEEWEKFPLIFKESTNSKEKQLYKKLTHLIPYVLDDIKKREDAKEERIRLAEEMRLQQEERARIKELEAIKQKELEELKEFERLQELQRKIEKEKPKRSTRLASKPVYSNFYATTDEKSDDSALFVRATGRYLTRSSGFTEDRDLF